MKTLAKALAATGLVAVTGLRSGVAAPTVPLEKRFETDVKPFVKTYCAGCHTGAKPAAQFDMGPYTSHSAVVKDLAHWDHVLSRVSTSTMPPKGMKQPSADERAKFVDWVRAVRMEEARKLDGDPGLVLARRLSNAEYNYTVRDLTGVDIQPAKEFPVDPANTAGFDNSGESLSMSPALMRKYLQAARTVADHMAVTPDGIAFAPHPMLVETDREKYAIQRIVNFYYSQPTDYADYFETAWKFKNKKAAGTLQSYATANHVSPKYMPLVWGMLEDRTIAEVGPVATLRKMWRELPANDEVERRRQCERMRDFVVKIRKATAMEFAAPVVKGLSPTSQPLMNYKFREFNTHRRKVDMKAFRLASEPSVEPARPGRYPGLGAESAGRAAILMANRRYNDPDLVIPANETRAQWEAAMTRFADVFPDNFYVSERGRFFPDDSEDKGRLLSAGYHNVMGYWRDDQPLRELILDAKGVAELEKLWVEFDYLGDHTMRTYVQYYFNQSGEVLGNGRESGNERPSDAAVSAPKVIFGLRDQYLAKAKEDPKNDPRAIPAIEYHFQWVNDTLRSVEKLRAESQPKHIEAMLKFAARAYRRPLTVAERNDLLAFYKSLRKDGTMTHEDAIRDVIVRVLMSPNFCYRVDQVSPPAVKMTSNKVTGAPLSNYDLASRLSYFLWSTSPDEKLVAKATAGGLSNRAAVLAEVRRMLQDPKARALATEFAGNWLDFRRFEQHNSVDSDRFPMFTNELREAMFEEPVRYMTDIIANDRSVLDLLYGKDTFINPVLAKHYGIPMPEGKKGWVKVDDASAYGRGGLLPMAAFLTQSSPGLRTSPVKRGYWVVKRVLGEQIPPPPPNVPELPQDEAKANKPLRQMLADHRNNPACAGCHARFDGFGLAFENYGPVGEKRAKDLAGRAIDTTAEFPGGKTGDGIAAVRDYIRGNRENDFVDNLSRVLLAYSLGRSLSLSDDMLVERMKTNLKAKNYKFSALVETIVQSPQFLNRRATDATSSAAATE